MVWGWGLIPYCSVHYLCVENSGLGSGHTLESLSGEVSVDGAVEVGWRFSSDAGQFHGFCLFSYKMED